MASVLRLLSFLGIVLSVGSAVFAAPFEGFEVPSGLGSFSTPTTGSIALVESGGSNGIPAPEGLKYATGVVSFSEAFNGFTLAEQMVLNRYRRRAA